MALSCNEIAKGIPEVPPAPTRRAVGVRSQNGECFAPLHVTIATLRLRYHDEFVICLARETESAHHNRLPRTTRVDHFRNKQENDRYQYTRSFAQRRLQETSAQAMFLQNRN